MISKEEAIRQFVEAYEIEVPQVLVDEEYELCVMDVKHRMCYGQMMGIVKMNPLEQAEAMAAMESELKETARYNVKEELVLKDVMKKQDFFVTAEELHQCAEDMARRQNSTMELIRKFFGENLELLEDDVKRQKAEDWICCQVNE